MSRYHNVIKVMRKVRYYTLAIQNFFRLNMVPKYYSEFQRFLRTYFFKFCPFTSVEILRLKIVEVFICSSIILSIKTSSPTGTCHLNAITLHLTGHIFIPNCCVVFSKVSNAFCDSCPEFVLGFIIYFNTRLLT
jgi:hypothetical protein